MTATMAITMSAGRIDAIGGLCLVGSFGSRLDIGGSLAGGGSYFKDEPNGINRLASGREGAGKTSDNRVLQLTGPWRNRHQPRGVVGSRHLCNTVGHLASRTNARTRFEGPVIEAPAGDGILVHGH